MRTSNATYLPAVDHLRALAALLVLELHASERFYYALAHHNADFELHAFIMPSPNLLTVLFVEGRSGVALFMVLSGFIFTYTAYGRTLDYARFLLNRVLRIYPLVLAITLVAGFVYGTLAAAPLLHTMLFPFKLPGGLITIGPYVNAGRWTWMFWTLSPEFQFYFAFPVLLSVLGRFGPVPLVLLIGATVLARAVLLHAGYDPLGVSYFTIAGRFDQFLVGMLGAMVLRRRNGAAVPAWLAAVAFVGVLFVLQWLNGLERADWEGRGWRAYDPLVEAAAWGLFVVAYVGAVGSARGAASRVLCWIGTISFSLYLLHYASIYVVIGHNWLLRPTGNLLVDTGVNDAVFALVMIAVASASYLAIEQPFLRLRLRYLDIQRREAAPNDASPLRRTLTRRVRLTGRVRERTLRPHIMPWRALTKIRILPPRMAWYRRWRGGA